MKKLASTLVVILALLLQLRVAYACEATGFWPAEPCDAHGVIAADHRDQPSDRDQRCDISLDLAVRAGRADGDGDALHVASLPTGPDVLALPPSALSMDGPLLATRAHGARRADRPAVGAGTRTWLRTARLRL